MTSSNQWRASRLAPSALLAAFLFAAACATSPPRPPVPISQGGERVPVDPDGGTTDPVDPGDVDVVGVDPDEEKIGDGGLTPPHMIDREEIKRAAVLLPFSHSNGNVRSEAEGMLAAIELALFDHAGEEFLILPKDTGGRPDVAEAKAEEAINEGADIIIGPLFGSNVQPVARVARSERVPVVAFSNDRQAAGGGAYLVSITPESEVESVVGHASRTGVRSFAFLGPDSAYGRRVESAFRSAVARNGGAVVISQKYGSRGEGQEEAARAVAQTLKNEPRGRAAVMIPESGTRLRAVAPLLPYNGLDVRRVKILGTGMWNDPSVWREPTLFGGLFAAPSPEDAADFSQSYQRIYGRAPKGLAGLGYDAAALSIQLAGEDRLTTSGVTDRDGFIGTNGLFRLRYDGLPDRGLAILEITPEGIEVAQPGKRSFSDRGS